MEIRESIDSFRRHKLFPFLFTLFSLILLVATYAVVQQRQVYRSKASERCKVRCTNYKTRKDCDKKGKTIDGKDVCHWFPGDTLFGTGCKVSRKITEAEPKNVSGDLSTYSYFCASGGDGRIPGCAQLGQCSASSGGRCCQGFPNPNDLCGTCIALPPGGGAPGGDGGGTGGGGGGGTGGGGAPPAPKSCVPTGQNVGDPQFSGQCCSGSPTPFGVCVASGGSVDCGDKPAPKLTAAKGTQKPGTYPLKWTNVGVKDYALVIREKNSKVGVNCDPFKDTPTCNLVKGLTNAFFKYEDGKTYEQYVQPWICGRLGKKSNVVEVMIKTGGAAGEKGDVTLDMMVRFQGFVPDTPERVDKVAGKKMRARVSISGMTYKVVEFTASASAEWQGRVTFKDVELNRRHRIYVWGQKHPQRRICDKTPKENRVGVYRCEDGLITLAKGVNKLDFTGILLLVGDLNIGSGQDNVVDAFDTTFVRQNFNSRNQVVLEKADFDLNGVINARDWALIQASLEVKPGDSLR